MADISRTVEIIFGAIDQTSTGLQSVASNIDKTVDSISAVTSPVADMTDSLVKAEAAIVATGAAMLAFAVNEAGKMSASVAEIGTLFNATSEQTDTLRGNIQTFAQDSTSAIDKINAATYVAISTGTEWTNVTDLLAVSERGAIAGATNLEVATSLLSRTMNAYGLQTNDAATNTKNAQDVMDALFVAVQNGDTTMEALSASLGKVASTAAAAKVPLPDLLAGIAALTTAGISTDQAMTLMNSALKELLNPSKELQAALGGMTLESDGLKAIMEQLQLVTGGSADKMFGLFSSVEAAKGSIILANDSAGTFGNTLTAMADRTGVVDKAFEAMAKNLDLATQSMINSFIVASQKIGEPLLDQWVDIIDALKLLFQGVSISVDDGAFDPVFTALNQFGAEAEKLLLRIAENLPAALKLVDFSGLIDSFQDLGLDIGSIFEGVDLTTPQGLAKAIQFVADSLETLTLFVKGVVISWKPTIETIVEFIAKLNESGDKSKEIAGIFGGASQQFEAFKAAIKGGADALDLMGKSLAVIAGATGISAFTGALTAASGSATVLSGALAKFGWAALILAAADAAKALYNGEKSSVGGAIDFLIQKTTGSNNLGEFVYSLNLMGEGAKENALKVSELEVNVQKLRNATGDQTITIENYNAKLAQFGDKTALAAELQNSLGGKIDISKTNFTDLNSVLELSKQTTGELTLHTGTLGDEFEKAGYKIDPVTGIITQLGNSLKAVDEAATTSTDGFKTFAEAEQYLADNAKAGNAQFIEYKDGLYQVTSGGFDAADATKALADETNKASLAANEGSKEWKAVQDVMLAAQKQTDDFQIAIGKLANERYEIDVKAAVDLQVAQIEADTARIAAAFTAASEAISTLTAGTTDLYGLFAEKVGFLGGDELLAAAQRMEDRLDEELELKRQLTEATVAQANATTQRLSSGEPLISIDAGTLAPELELVFDKILKFTQIRATQEGLSLLVGL